MRRNRKKKAADKKVAPHSNISLRKLRKKGEQIDRYFRKMEQSKDKKRAKVREILKREEGLNRKYDMEERKLEIKEKEAEARTELKRKEIELRQEDKIRQSIEKRRERQEERSREIEAEIGQSTHGVFVKDDDGPVDIRRDVEWVYKNLPRLIVISDSTGEPEFNKRILKQAPSNGAINIAEYALKDKKAFFKDYVPMLFRDMVRREEKEVRIPTVEEEVEEDIDPTLEDLDKYMGVSSEERSNSSPGTNS